MEQLRLFVRGKTAPELTLDASMRGEIVERCLAKPSEVGSATCRELYAMPAATQNFLDDDAIDIRRWFVDEIPPVFSDQLCDRPASLMGDIKVIRDPYSVTPCVLFYVTAVMPEATDD